MAEEKRLKPKYIVYKITNNVKVPVKLSPGVLLATDPSDVNSPFVLMPRKDPAAFMAMLAYASVCEPSLANEIRVWLSDIAKSTPDYGDQGFRNKVAMQLRQIQEFGF
jgi:hypothetical protein